LFFAYFYYEIFAYVNLKERVEVWGKESLRESEPDRRLLLGAFFKKFEIIFMDLSFEKKRFF
jgi:hypothetical protein